MRPALSDHDVPVPSVAGPPLARPTVDARPRVRTVRRRRGAVLVLAAGTAVVALATGPRAMRGAEASPTSPDSRPEPSTARTTAPSAGATTTSPGTAAHGSTTSTSTSTSTSLVLAPGAGRAPSKAALQPTGSTLPPAGLTVRVVPVAVADQPVAITARPGDTALYVVEKEGRIRRLRSGTLDPRPSLDLRGRVAAENERGLLGLAFPPQGGDLAYIDYTDLSGTVVVSELRINDGILDPASERVLLRMPKKFNEHNAGTLSFGADGTLFIAIGDGGGSGDKSNNAQNRSVLLGKVLRIDPRPDTRSALPYSIPSDNPFAQRDGLTVSSARPEIYAYGLRNPWRATVDPASGDLWIPDVGESAIEEINWVPRARAGANLGWSLREGRQAFKGARPTGALDPVYDYPHKDGRCAVVGGFPYRGGELRGAQGWYVFGDVCSGALSVLKREGGAWKAYSLGAKVSYLTAFGTDLQGELYAMSLEGPIYRLSA